MHKPLMRSTVLLLIWALCASRVLAHGEERQPNIVPVDAMLTGAFDPDNPVETQVLWEGFYVLFGVGGNILVSSGEDGVLIVDDQFPFMWKKLGKAMRQQGDRKIDFIVNTHWHFDHADGNLELGQEEGTWIVSQANSRAMLLEDQVIDLVAAAVEQPAYPKHALPDITYDDTMQIHLNGERIDLLHTGPAHTTGDTAVIFRGHNAVHMGDVFNNAGYPFIDAGNGGSLDGVIAFCEAVLATIDEDTVVVPGHGPVVGYTELNSYVHMLKTVRGELLAMIKAGKSLAEISAAGITETWDATRGDPTSFIDRSYTSLVHRYIP